MLNVYRRPDVDAGIEQLLDVLPAFRVPRTRLTLGEVRVRKLIDQDDLGPPPQRGVEVELAAHRAAISHRQHGQLLESFQQALGFLSTMRLDVTHDDVAPCGALDAGRLEHRVCLADPCRSAEENTQTSTPRASLLGLHCCEQLVGVRPLSGRVHADESRRCFRGWRPVRG